MRSLLILLLAGCGGSSLGSDGSAGDLGPSNDLAGKPLQFVAQSSGTTENLTDVRGRGDDVWAVGGAGTVLHSVDHGSTWTLQPSGTMEDLYGVVPTMAGDLLAFGALGLIRVSHDRGATWSAQNSGVPETIFGGFEAPDGVLYLVGGHGTILRSSNGGAAWMPRTSGVTVELHRAWGPSSNELFIAGEFGTILHSTNGGTIWQSEIPNTQEHLHDIWGTSPNDVYAVGDKGTLLHSTNGAMTWPQVSIDPTPTAAFRGVWGAVVAGDDQILRGPDFNGAFPLPSMSGRSFKAVWGTSESDVYVVGDGGTILHLE